MQLPGIRAALSCLLVFATLCCSVPAVNAGALVVGDKLKLNWTNFPGADGEFGAFLSTNDHYNSPSTQVGGNEDFRTFCVQLNEYVYSVGDVLVVENIATTTASTDPDRVLTKNAAWLYRQFAGLSSLNYNGSIGVTNPAVYNTATGTNAEKVAYANYMQVALWKLMGWNDSWITSIMGNVDFITNNVYLQLVADNAAAINAWNAVDNGTSIGGVSILNLVRESGGNAQDMLYWDGVDSPVALSVPEPMSVGLWLTTIAFGALVYRRRQICN